VTSLVMSPLPYIVVYTGVRGTPSMSSTSCTGRNSGRDDEASVVQPGARRHGIAGIHGKDGIVESVTSNQPIRS
jgi:hypothetical protein